MRERNPREASAGTSSLNRRRFLAGCAACAGAAGLSGAPRWLCGGQSREKARVRILYALHGVKQEGPDWPNKGFDFGPAMEMMNAELTRLRPEVSFMSSMANGPEQAQRIIDADRASPVDGYLVFQMNCWNRVVQSAAATGKPVLYADFQFGGSGGFLVYTAQFLRAGARNVGFIASSDFSDSRRLRRSSSNSPSNIQ
jgi:hypothetical protein